MNRSSIKKAVFARFTEKHKCCLFLNKTADLQS